MRGQIPFYMITNIGNLLGSPYVQNYSRHLLLAQVIRDTPHQDLVLQTLRNMQSRGCRFILDNGAYEEAAFDEEWYTHLIRELKPTQIVLPDLVNHPHKESLEAGFRFWTTQKSKWGYEPIPMIVPQGDTREDVLKGYKALCDPAFLPIQNFVVGIGKAYLHWVPTVPGQNPARSPYRDQDNYRFDMFRSIINLIGARGRTYHILGGRVNPFHRWAEYAHYIQGLDAYEPIHWATKRILYPEPFYGSRIPHLDTTEAASEGLIRANVENFCEAYGLRNMERPFTTALAGQGAKD